MKSFNALNSPFISKLDHTKSRSFKLFLLSIAVILSIIGTPKPALAQTPLPSFGDPMLQECFNEQAITNGWLFAEDVIALTCQNRGIQDAYGLEQLVNLNTLDLTDNNIEDIHPIVYGVNGPLPTKELRLGNNRITDIQPLQAFYELEVLWLSGNTGIDWYQLRSIINQNPGLTQLGLGSIHFDETGIPGFSIPVDQIIALDVSNTGIEGLWGLEQYSSLESLDASNNRITDLNPLFGSNGPLPIKELHLSNNRITDVQPLQQFYNLTMLWLSDNASIDWNQLQQIINQNPGLTQLGLGGIHFDETGIPGFSIPVNQIVALDVSNTGIEGLWGLEQYSSLESLDVSNNRITELNPLLGSNGPLPIKELRLGNNRITDVQPLQQFYNLTVLWLSDNASIDWNQLQQIINQNPGLTQLGLGGIHFDETGIPGFSIPVDQIIALDVSNTGIEGLWGLEQYSNLESLNASNNHITELDPLLGSNGPLPIKELRLENNNITDVQPLQFFYNLNILWLSGNTGIDWYQLRSIIDQNPGLTQLGLGGIHFDETGIPGFNIPADQIVALDVSNTGIEGLWGLEQYSNLESLNASNNRITDLNPLFGSNGPLPIKELHLSNNRITDVQPLQQFYNLTVLWLSGNASIEWDQLQQIINHNPGLTQLGLGGINLDFQDFPFFSFLADQITALDVSNTGIANLNGLEQYSNLESLNASNNRITELGPLLGSNSPLPIKELHLSSNRITDMQPLQQFYNLTVLWLSGNSGIDWNQLQQIINQNPGLTQLGLGGINLDFQDFPFFSFLADQITALDVSNTGITNLDGLEQYSNLESLDASNNHIAELGPLFGFNGPLPIKELRLGNNRITDIQSLQSFYNFNVLWLSGNAGIDWNQLRSIIDQNPKLTQLGLGGINFDQPVIPTFNIPRDQIIALDVSNTGIMYLDGLEEYSSLESLDASDNNILDISPVMFGINGPLPLKELHLSNNRITNIQPLQSFYDLTVLWLSNNTGIDWHQLRPIIDQNPGLTQLGLGGINFDQPSIPLFNIPIDRIIALDMSNTGIMNLDGLEEYSRLESLDASDNNIVNIYSLFGSNGPLSIKELRLANNHITDVQPLQQFYDLTMLWLSGNTGIDWNQLKPIIDQNSELTQLGLGSINFNQPNMPAFYLPVDQITALDVSNTGIANLNGLEQYSNLESLDASNNRIAELGPLFGFNGPLPIKELRLGNNRITDIQPLQSFYNFNVLWLSGNTGIDWYQLRSLIDQNPKLTQLGLGSINFDQPVIPTFNIPRDQIIALDVSNTGIMYLAGLEEYSRLESLDASNNNLMEINSLFLLQNIRLVDLHGNLYIPCDQLDQLEGMVSIESVIRPATCIIGYAPDITIQFPIDGIMTIEGWTETLIGSAYDFEDGDLSASISWNSSLSGLLGTGTPLDVQFVPGVQTITASITDSSGNTKSQSVQIEVIPNEAPVVIIASPLPESVVMEGNPVIFAGDATDAEDGNLSTAIIWNSNLDGALGSGAFIEHQLSVGIHTITATVSDSLGKTDSTSVVVTVELNNVPTLDLLSPTTPVTLFEGIDLALQATANDVEDGDLTAAIAWSSNLDGALGSGGNVLQQLSIGAHTITAIVSDSLGKSASASVVVTVEFNNAPTLDLLSPTTPVTLFEGIDLALQATASDVEDGDLTATIAWSSSLDGALGSGGNVLQQLSIGVHAITATVSDNLSKTASASVMITVELNNAPTLEMLTTPVTIFEGTNLTLQATANDIEDGDLTAAIAWSSNLDGALGSGGNVLQQLSIGVHTITATVSDSLGKNTSDSVVVTVEVNNAPTLEILTTPVTIFEGISLTLLATANDVEDGNLTAAIAWNSNLDGALGSGGSVASQLSIGVHTLTATVSDSLGKNDSASVVVTVAVNNTPTLEILTAPATIFEGTSITLQATAADVEDGDLTASTAWSSNLDGALGSGGNVLQQLSIGVHTITAIVNDSLGKSASDSVVVTVELNNAPTVQILNPAAPVTFFEDTSLTLQATANDVEDGNLSSSIVWHSSVVGELGTGSNISVTLPIGTHAVSATITDSLRKTAIETTQITVEFNNPPIITITSPSDGFIIEDGLSITLSAISSDIEDGNLTSSIEWHSSIIGHLGTGNNLSVQLPLGNHNIDATVSDLNGKRANAVNTISVSMPPLISYCTAEGRDANREWIDQVSIAGITNISHSQGGYGDFWGLGPIYLNHGSNTVTLTPGSSRNARNEQWNVWIDLNRDGIFADNELLLSTSESGVINGSITIPTSAITGNTRLRIAMRSRGWPSSCGTFRRGEVEDYRVILQL